MSGKGRNERTSELPLSALEEPDDINRFKTESDYAEDVELATLHRTLETLRAADQLGARPNATVVHEVSVSSVRRPLEQESGDEP